MPCPCKSAAQPPIRRPRDRGAVQGLSPLRPTWRLKPRQRMVEAAAAGNYAVHRPTAIRAAIAAIAAPRLSYHHTNRGIMAPRHVTSTRPPSSQYPHRPTVAPATWPRDQVRGAPRGQAAGSPARPRRERPRGPGASRGPARLYNVCPRCKRLPSSAPSGRVSLFTGEIAALGVLILAPSGRGLTQCRHPRYRHKSPGRNQGSLFPTWGSRAPPPGTGDCRACRTPSNIIHSA